MQKLSVLGWIMSVLRTSHETTALPDSRASAWIRSQQRASLLQKPLLTRGLLHRDIMLGQSSVQSYDLRVYSELDTNLFPLAYLITFRTYGTWMHGEARGSIDRKHNVYGTPRLPEDRHRKEAETRQLKQPPLLLNGRQRKIVESAIRDVCRFRRYDLLAVNARSNHVHTVIGAARSPEPIVETLKAWTTRRLREAGLISATIKPWARHGSTRYLWKDNQVGNAVAYVMFEQGE